MKEKRKKSLWKRLLIWFGGFFLLVLIVLVSIPFLFKDEIIDLIRKTANESLNAELNFSDADLTFLSTFPNLTLTIDDVTLEGVEEFDGVTLAQVEKTTLKLDFWAALFGDQYQIDEIYLDNPIVHIKVLENGKANYDIVKTDSTATEEPASPFKLALEKYVVTNGDITYDDLYYATYIHLANVNHEGSITIEDVVYNLSTTTVSDHVTFAYDGFNYLENSKANVECDLEIEMPEDEMTLTFRENHALINELDLHFDGSMFMNDELMDFDFAFNALNQNFKSLLSVVPGAYSGEFNSISTDGEIDIHGSLFGKYTDTDMPGFDVTTIVKNAWLQYPELPDKLENINLDLNIYRPEGPDFDNLEIALKSMNLEFLKNKFGLSFLLKHPLTDPDIDATIVSELNLAELRQVIPMNEGENYSGYVHANINVAGRASAIEQEKYEEFEASGELMLEAINYNSPNVPYPVEIDSVLFRFSPAALELAQFNAGIGSSDIHLNGELNNYLGYLLKDDTIQGNLNFTSTLLNLDELMGSYAATDETTEKSAEMIDSSAYEVFQIPGNIDFLLATAVDGLVYDSVQINNVGGTVHIKNSVATLENIKMKLFEGDILLNGSYEALEPKLAQTQFSYDIEGLDFKDAANYFTSIEHYAPILKYCEGKLSTKMELETHLDEFYYPVYQSLNGLGDLKSSEVKIDNLPMFDKIVAHLKTVDNPLENQKIQNLNLSFSFENGRLQLEETPIKLGKISSTLVGSTGFDQTIDYTWQTEFPSSLLGASAQSIANELLGQVGEATGVNVSVPSKLPINFSIGGTVKNPTISSDLKQTGQSVVNDLIDQGLDKINEEAKKILAQAQEQIDQLLAEAAATADKIRAEADAQAAKLEEEADKAHQKAYDEADKQAEKLRQEGYDAADQLIENASNPLEKLAAKTAAEQLKKETDQKVEVLRNTAYGEADKAKDLAYDNAGKIRTEADTKAQKVEDTAQTQADQIMNDAHEKVDNLTE
jgi:hypothetical protein